MEPTKDQQMKLLHFAREMTRTDLRGLVDKYVNELYDILFQGDNLISADTASVVASVNFEGNIEAKLTPDFKVNTSLEMFPQEPGVWNVVSLNDNAQTDSKATDQVEVVKPKEEEEDTSFIPLISETFVESSKQKDHQPSLQADHSINGSNLDVFATQPVSSVLSPNFTFSTIETCMPVDIINEPPNNDTQPNPNDDIFVPNVTLLCPLVFPAELENFVPSPPPFVEAALNDFETYSEPIHDANVSKEVQNEGPKEDKNKVLKSVQSEAQKKSKDEVQKEVQTKSKSNVLKEFQKVSQKKSKNEVSKTTQKDVSKKSKNEVSKAVQKEVPKKSQNVSPMQPQQQTQMQVKLETGSVDDDSLISPVNIYYIRCLEYPKCEENCLSLRTLNAHLAKAHNIMEYRCPANGCNYNASKL